jgi:hypothetical protein
MGSNGQKRSLSAASGAFFGIADFNDDDPVIGKADLYNAGVEVRKCP